jgi:hypothetical protein
MRPEPSGHLRLIGREPAKAQRREFYYRTKMYPLCFKNRYPGFFSESLLADYLSGDLDALGSPAQPATLGQFGFALREAETPKLRGLLALHTEDLQYSRNVCDLTLNVDELTTSRRRCNLAGTFRSFRTTSMVQ